MIPLLVVAAVLAGTRLLYRIAAMRVAVAVAWWAIWATRQSEGKHA